MLAACPNTHRRYKQAEETLVCSEKIVFELRKLPLPHVQIGSMYLQRSLLVLEFVLNAWPAL